MTALNKSLSTLLEIPLSKLVAGFPIPHLESHSECHFIRVTVQQGMDVTVLKGNLQKSMMISIRDDWDRIHFFCPLQGSPKFFYENKNSKLENILNEGFGCIRYTQDCKGRSLHTGRFESVIISVRPDVLIDLIPSMDISLRQKFDSARCYAKYCCNAEMRITAQTLNHALCAMHTHPNHSANHTSLWLLGQSLVLTSLAIEAYQDNHVQYADAISVSEKQNLLRAKDMLLADLSKAPTIADLAKETGLSIIKLRRGFRQFFNNSVYGLFQQERMHEARRRLCVNHTSVMTVAADLGYANASHFTAAFQKQFGVNPSVFKRHRFLIVK